jgi:hypothetical protein
LIKLARRWYSHILFTSFSGVLSSFQQLQKAYELLLNENRSSRILQDYQKEYMFSEIGDGAAAGGAMETN